MEIKFTSFQADKVKACIFRLRSIIQADPNKFGSDKPQDVGIYKTTAQILFDIDKQLNPDLDHTISYYLEDNDDE